MKIKEVALSEIHWSINRWNEGKQANDELRKRLGDTAQYFATCNVGHAYYQWNTNINGNWLPLTDADANQLAMAEQRLTAIRSEVNAKMGSEPELAEQLFEVPTKDYIYFSTTPDGQLNVVITGWGFRNFKKDPPFRIKTPPRKTAVPNTIAFAIDNERLPNRAFTLKAPWTTKPDQKVTGPDGLFSIEEAAGTNLEIVDVETGKRFTVTLSDATPDHMLDITENTALTVQATLDGMPLDGEPVSVDHGGQHFDLVLVGGVATIPYLSLHPGHSCQVIVRGEEQNIELQKQKPNLVTFNFVTPPPAVEEPPMDIPVPPAVNTARLTVVDAAGMPLRQAHFRLEQGAASANGTLDEQGQATFIKDAFQAGQPVSAAIITAEGQPLPPAQLVTDPTDNDYILQLKAPQGRSRMTELLMLLLLALGLTLVATFVFQPLIGLISNSII